MKARKVKVTPLQVHVPSARSDKFGNAPGKGPATHVTLEAPDTRDSDFPRLALVDTAKGRIPVLVENVTRVASYDNRVRLYHATVTRKCAGYVKGQRVWVDVKACTWIDDLETDDSPPSGAARRRARKRAAEVRRQTADIERQIAEPAPPRVVKETRLPTLFEQTGTNDK